MRTERSGPPSTVTTAWASRDVLLPMEPTGWSMRETKWIVRSLAALIFLAAGVAEAKPEGAGVFFGVGGGSSTYDQDRGDFDSIARNAFAGAGLPVVSLQSQLDDSDNT